MAEPKTAVARPADPGGALTPARVSELIELAIREGKGPEAVSVIERLVDVAERVDARRAMLEFNAAYAAFRQECPAVPKSGLAKVTTKSGASFDFSYAPYEEIRRVCDPHLHRNGLSVSHDSEDKPDAITGIVRLRHIGGHCETSRYTVRKGGANDKMALGQQDNGTLTMALRRALAMALGIVTSDAEDEKPTGDRITERQAADLDLAIENAGAKRANFLSTYGIARTEDLPASMLKPALTSLERIRRRPTS